MDRLAVAVVSVRRLLLPAFAVYSALAVLQTWPLVLHLSTRVTGIPGGDTGVYVWNTWVFRHELIERGHWPFSTSMLLPLAGPASLGLHNYTAVADLLTLPLQPWLGVVGAFNVVYLLNVALSGLGLFVLAHHVTGKPAASMLAGALFAWSPFLVARGTAHFSLAAAAPLPFFLYWFDRTWLHGRTRDALLAGAAVAWAAYSDPYYAIYCAMLAGVVSAARLVTVASIERREHVRALRRATDALAAAVVASIVVVYGLAGGELRLGTLSVSMHTLYTPMLLLALLLGGRVVLTWRTAITWQPLPRGIWLNAFVMVTSAAVLMAPELIALAGLAAESRFVRAPVLWRSSAPGVDALAFWLPNPNHPWAPAALVEWVARQPGRFEENVVSVSWVAIATIVAARRWTATRLSRFWLGLTLGFAALALGPFIVVGGHRTFFPTPWTLLRYVPIIGDARMPQRFAVLTTLGLSVMFAQALAALGVAYAVRWRRLAAAVCLGLAVELLSAPRPLYAADVPAVFDRIAADDRQVSVLEVPFGVRDGLSSLGDFGPGSMLFQTVHHKPIVGGYLSRVDERTKDLYASDPVLSVLIAFSEGRRPTDAALARARDAAPAFAAELHVGYVVIDRDRVPVDAQRLLVEALALERLDADGPLDLFRVPPSTTPPR